MVYLIFTILLFSVIIISIVFFKSFNLTGKLKKAKLLFDEGKLNESSKIVRDILEKDKNNIQAHYLRGQILVEEKQYLMAISEFNSLLNMPNFSLYVSEAEIHYKLAAMYNATGNYKKEIEEYKMILIFNPEDIQANLRLGQALYNKKDYKEAKNHLIQVVQNDPTQTIVFLPLGISLLKLGESDKGEEWLLKALEIDPDNLEIKFYLGSLLKERKNYNDALTMLNQSKNDSKYYIPSLIQIGEIYFEQNLYDKVLETLEPGLNKINDSNEDGLTLRYLLGKCYENKGMLKEARTQWEIIVRNDPDYRDAKQNLDNYKNIMRNDQLIEIFAMSMDKLQPYIIEILLTFNYNVISQEYISANECKYKAYNMKRISDAPTVILFDKTTREIVDTQLNRLEKIMKEENCKNALYMTTGSFNIKVKSSAPSRQIELYDGAFLSKAIEKIKNKHTIRTRQ